MLSQYVFLNNSYHIDKSNGCNKPNLISTIHKIRLTTWHDPVMVFCLQHQALVLAISHLLCCDSCDRADRAIIWYQACWNVFVSAFLCWGAETRNDLKYSTCHWVTKHFLNLPECVGTVLIWYRDVSKIFKVPEVDYVTVNCGGTWNITIGTEHCNPVQTWIVFVLVEFWGDLRWNVQANQILI